MSNLIWSEEKNTSGNITGWRAKSSTGVLYFILHSNNSKYILTTSKNDEKYNYESLEVAQTNAQDMCDKDYIFNA